MPVERMNLLTVSRRGDTAGIRQCLKAGDSPNCVDESGFTPLMLLASQGLGECLQLVLDSPGCIVNKRTSSMQVALHFAAEKGHADCVRRLLTNRAMVNVSNDWGETPLIKAVNSGDLPTVRMLLKHNAKMEMTDLQGYNALIHAARLGNVPVASALVEQGACVNHGTKTHPLHQAVAYGHVDMVRFLLSFGAKLTIRDLHGWLPIEIATQTDQAGAINCLVDHGVSQEDVDSAISAAARYGAVKSMKVLLMRGGDPDATDYQGLPALFTAINLSNTDIVWQLIRHNCNVNRNISRAYLPDPELRDLFAGIQADPVSPLMIAVVRGNVTVVRMLACCGATPGNVLGVIKLLRHWPSVVSFSWSSSSSNSEVVRWLLDYFSGPLSLAHLSRLAVRRALGRNAVGAISRLPIPRQLMEYVELRDLVDFLELKESD